MSTDLPQPPVLPHYPPQDDDAVVPAVAISQSASTPSQLYASPVPVKRPRGRPKGRGKGRATAHNWSRIPASAVEGDAPDDCADNDYRSLSRKPLPEPRPDSGSETHTKSGRKVVRPAHLVPATVPTIRRPRARRIDPCQICSLASSGRKNQLVVCDGCSSVFHQLCHEPVIDDSAVANKEPAWLCADCQPLRAMAWPPSSAADLVNSGGIAKADRDEYLQTLSHDALISMVNMLTDRYPEAQVFPRDLQKRLADYRAARSKQRGAATPGLGDTSSRTTLRLAREIDERGSIENGIARSANGGTQSLVSDMRDREVSNSPLPPLPGSELERLPLLPPKGMKRTRLALEAEDEEEADPEPLPSYEDMIAEALTYINDPHGSTPRLIWEYLADTYPLLPNFRPSAGQALRRGAKRSRFRKEGNLYKLNPDFEEPAQDGKLPQSRRPRRDPARNVKMGANRKVPREYATPLSVVEKQQKLMPASRTMGDLDDFEMEDDEDMLDSDQEDEGARQDPGNLLGPDELGDEQDYQLEGDAPASQESANSDSLAVLLSEFMQSHANDAGRVINGSTYDQLHHLTGKQTQQPSPAAGASVETAMHDDRELSIDPALASLLGT